MSALKAADDCALLAPNRFYWGVLDASSLGRSRLGTQQLGYLFECMLPITIESVHAVYISIDVGVARRYVACGMDRNDLQQAISDAGTSCVTLRPSGLPNFVCDLIGNDDTISHRVNLLVGEFEPPTITSRRTRCLQCGGVALVVCTLLIVAGLERRVHDADRQAMMIHQKQTRTFGEVLGDSMQLSSQPPELQLTSELRLLRQTRHRPEVELEQPEATVALAQVLAAWPKEQCTQTDAIIVGPSILTIRTTVASSSDVQRMADSLKAVSGWKLLQPQVNAAAGASQATIQLKRVGAATP